MRLDLFARAAALAALLAVSPPMLMAQTPFYGPRATGMAGAMTAVANDGTALWTNPAGLARDRRTDLDLFGNALASERGALREDLEPLSGLDLPALAEDPSGILDAIGDLSSLAEPGTGVVGSGAAGLVFGWSGLAVGIGDVAYAGVYPAVDLTHILPGENPATSIEFNETALRSAGLEAREVRLALSKAFLQGVLLVGVTGRYVMGQTTYSSQSVFDLDLGNPMTIARQALKENPLETNHFTFDAGAMLNILGRLRVAIVSTAVTEPSFSVAQDPANPSLAGAPESLKLPRTVRAGAAFEPIGALTLAVDGDLVASDTLIPGGQSQQISTGIEVRLPLFAIRAGAFRDLKAPDPHWAYSAGFGIGLAQLSVNGAVVLSTYSGLSLSSANQRDVGAALDARFRF